MAAALVLASCGPSVEPGEQEEEEEEEPVGQQEEEEEEEEEEEPVGEQEEEEKPKVGVPIYGGIITSVHTKNPTAGVPDPFEMGYPSWYWMSPVLDRLFVGDLETDPRRGGDGEFVFNTIVPQKAYVGSLAESWEATASKITLYIRQGVYFTGISPNKVMDKREYTAHDYVWNLRRQMNFPAGNQIRTSDFISTPYEETIYAEDDFTVVIETSRPNPEWMFDLQWLWGYQIAHESIEAGAGVWDNIVGTGPFTIKKYVAGSHLEYARNPFYWKKATIDGIEYEVPFVDGLIIPIINEETTIVAAIRTGVFDIYQTMPALYQSSLQATNPWLNFTLPSPSPDSSWVFRFRMDIPPFDDPLVREALMIGTDREGLVRAALVGSLPHNWPLSAGVEGYVPLEDFPPEISHLYDYNPDLARQMLAEAGVADGFKIRVIAARRPLMPELLEMLAGVWLEDFNIEIEMVIVELPMGNPEAEKGKHNAILTNIVTGPMPQSLLRTPYYSTAENNLRGYSYNNPYYDEMLDKASVMMDPVEREAIYEELFLLLTSDAVGIPFSFVPGAGVWQPWVKNYFGEHHGYSVHVVPYDLMWLDADLKAEMGY